MTETPLATAAVVASVAPTISEVAVVTTAPSLPTPTLAAIATEAAPKPTPIAVASRAPKPKPKPKLKPSPQDLEFLTGKADTLFQEKRFGDAKDEYLFILQQEPNWANAHFGLAKVYESQNDAKSACREFARYVTLAPAGKFSFTAGKKLSTCK